MCERPTATDRRTESGLSLAFGTAVMVEAASIVYTLVAGASLAPLVNFLPLGLAVVLYLLRFRTRRTMVLALGLGMTVLVLALLPAEASTSVLLILVTQVVIAFDVGFAVAAAMSVIYAVAFSFSAVLIFDGPVDGAIIENAFIALLLLVAAGVGSLMRTAEKARAEAAAVGADLAQANVALRRSLLLERDLVLAEERARSARELHDGLGHRLTLVALSLEYAQQTWKRDPEKAVAEVETAAETNRGALAEMRLWVRALDPPVADEAIAGAAAFDAIADAFRGTGLDVRVAYRGEGPPLGHDVALFATRFIQEGLTNVLRHADASRVDIEVLQSPHQVRFSISDDGTGADSPAEGFGRRSLRERVEILSGVMTAGTSPLGGFELSAVVPLTQEL